MNLNESQRQQVTRWVGEGLKLSEIQKRLEAEFGLRLTYMEARLLVDDLNVVPKDPEPAPPPAGQVANAGAAPKAAPETEPEAEENDVPAAGKVSVTLDQLARPGAMVSGKVTFSDGQKAEWYLSQDGRLGLVPSTAGYRPPAGDVQEFQIALQKELAKVGF